VGGESVGQPPIRARLRRLSRYRNDAFEEAVRINQCGDADEIPNDGGMSPTFAKTATTTPPPK
jgi:hypothetical protein